jgi:hypothetical protein
VEPKSGGETPIVLSHYVYKRMKEKFTEFVEKLEKDGLIYTRLLGEGDVFANWPWMAIDISD